MTPTSFSGTIIGIVDFGLSSATAYVVVSERGSNLDLNGDGDTADVQIRMAVGSPELVVVPGAPPDGFGETIFKPGFLTVWGSGNRPTTSNVNFSRAGMTIPNLAIVPIGEDGKIRVYNDGGSHIIVDLFGTIAGDGVNPHPPERILDTRNTATPTAGATIEVTVNGTPGDAVIANVTATNVTSPGYVTVWPSGPRPNASNLNPEYPGQSIANLVLTRIGPDNKIRLYTHNGADLIVDTFATIAAS